MTLTMARSQSQQTAKLFSFIFSHTFQLIMMKFDEVFKQFKMSILILLLMRFM